MKISCIRYLINVVDECKKNLRIGFLKKKPLGLATPKSTNYQNGSACSGNNKYVVALG